MLAIASVEGEVFTAEVVARVQGLDEDEVLGHLSGPLSRQHNLVRAHSLEHLHPGGQRLSRYHFRHHLFRKHLYDRLDVMERAHLHEAVGHRLEALHQTDAAALATVASRLAFHFDAAGLVGKAVVYLLQAARRALLLSANEEAMALYRQGLALLETLPASDERDRSEMDLQTLLIYSLSGVGRWGVREQLEAATRAYELSQRLEESGPLVPALLRLAGIVIGQGEHRQGLDLSGQALRLAQQAKEPPHLALAHQRVGVLAENSHPLEVQPASQHSSFA